MAAVTSAIIGAAALVNTVEQQRQAKRLAGQAKDREQAQAEAEQKAVDFQDQKVRDTRARNQRRASLNRAVSGLGGNIATPSGAPTSPGTLLGSGTGQTLLGS